MALAIAERLWFSPLTDPPQRWVMIPRMPDNCSTGVNLEVMNCVCTETQRMMCTLDFCSVLAAKNEQPHSYTTQQAYHMQHEPIIKGLEIWTTSIGGSQRFVFGHVAVSNIR